VGELRAAAALPTPVKVDSDYRDQDRSRISAAATAPLVLPKKLLAALPIDVRPRDGIGAPKGTSMSSLFVLARTQCAHVCSRAQASSERVRVGLCRITRRAWSCRSPRRYEHRRLIFQRRVAVLASSFH